jgi:ADP-ribosylglycohydrolase
MADALADGYSLEQMARNFVAWWQDKKYTSHDRLFDIGQRTLLAFNELLKILERGDLKSLEYLHYEASVHSNGNGALMRILPMHFYLQGKPINAHFDEIWHVSALTHPHIRSALAGYFYLNMLDLLQRGNPVDVAYVQNVQQTKWFMNSILADDTEFEAFARILSGDLASLPEAEIKTSAYVIDTLEASFWCLLNTSSYEEAVLKAVNLGHDTDTTGAVTGGMAGILYGMDAIPKEWVAVLPKREVIDATCDRLVAKYPGTYQ